MKFEFHLSFVSHSEKNGTGLLINDKEVGCIF